MYTRRVKLIANSQTEGVRTRGRPRSRWWESVSTDLRREGLRTGGKYLAIGMNGRTMRRRRPACLCRTKKKKEEEEDEEKKKKEEEEEEGASVTKAWVTNARSEATFANYVHAIKVAQSFRRLAITLTTIFPPAAREPAHSSLAIKKFGCVETKAIQDYIPTCLYL
jgi:hypothetical protein